MNLLKILQRNDHTFTVNYFVFPVSWYLWGYDESLPGKCGTRKPIVFLIELLAIGVFGALV